MHQIELCDFRDCLPKHFRIQDHCGHLQFNRSVLRQQLLEEQGRIAHLQQRKVNAVQLLRYQCHFVLYEAFVVAVKAVDEGNVAELLFAELVLYCLIVKFALLHFFCFP